MRYVVCLELEMSDAVHRGEEQLNSRTAILNTLHVDSRTIQ